jgi:hypothetical protein
MREIRECSLVWPDLTIGKLACLIFQKYVLSDTLIKGLIPLVGTIRYSCVNDWHKLLVQIMMQEVNELLKAEVGSRLTPVVCLIISEVLVVLHVINIYPLSI